MKLPIANGRSVEEWRGKSPDEQLPDRVRLRVWDRGHGRCHRCERSIRAGEKWTLEHLIALINWRATKEYPHGNVESNLGITCDWCLPIKNGEDAGNKSAVHKHRVAHVLPRKETSRGFRRPPGTTFDWNKGRYVREER